MTGGPLSQREQERVVVVCGDVAPHQRLVNPEFWAACGLTLVRCSENSASVFSLCEKLQPGLLIARQSFLEAQPATKLAEDLRGGLYVLAIMEQSGMDRMTGLIHLGCRGVLPPRLSAKLLKRAINFVMAGELWAPRSLISSMLSEFLASYSPVASLAIRSPLTARQQHILELIHKGYKNSEIATFLFISQETVRWHKRRLYRKVSVTESRRNMVSESRKSAVQVPGRCAV